MNDLQQRLKHNIFAIIYLTKYLEVWFFTNMNDELSFELRKEFAIALNTLIGCYENTYGSLSKNEALRTLIFTTALRMHTENEDFDLFYDNHENGLNYDWLLTVIMKEIEMDYSTRTPKVPKPRCLRHV